MINYFLKIFRFAFILLSCSYLLGIIWYILILIEYQEEEFFEDYQDPNMDKFYTYFNLDQKTAPQLCVIVTYFVFTTLSTVGFGDFFPKSNFERIFWSIILLSGVSMFSYIMGNFI